MKKCECFEIRFYELIGVRFFRKLVFLLERFIHRKDKGNNINYHIPYKNIESLDAFIKYIFYNGAIHVRNTIAISLYFIIKFIMLHRLDWYDVFVGLLLLKDVFCVILQRYNYLRIKQRKDILVKKRNQQIEREAAKVNLSVIENYTTNKIDEDLSLIYRLREGLANKASVTLSDEDVEKLSRLSLLLQSRK